MTKKAFTAIEYAVLIAVIVAALVGMSVYLKRAVMGKWRQAGDSFGQGRQYASGITTIVGSFNQPPPPATPLQQLQTDLAAALTQMSNIFSQAVSYNTTTGQYGSIAGLTLANGEQVYYRRGLLGAARSNLWYQTGGAVGPLTLLSNHLLNRVSSINDPGISIVSNGNQHTITMTMRWDPNSPESAANPQVTNTIVVYSL